MIQVDMQKAFDRVHHDVIRAVLKRANVGKVLYDGIRMAYTGCTTKLVVNNSLTPKIPVLSSVRQGCPLSPLLFSLYLEPLCSSVIQSKNVTGFFYGLC